MPPRDPPPPSDIDLIRVLQDDGSADEVHVAATDPALLVRGYREMRRLRALDAKMVRLQRQGRVGFYGAAEGQEAVPVATGLLLEKTDWVFPALREQSVMLVRGFPMDLFVAQIFGNALDLLKGRQMPSHPSGRAVHHVSWSPCIGTQLPQAVGTAWAMKHQKSAEVTVGFCGDGATSEPDFHAAMNFAGVFRTPSVLICQNNHWSISVPTSRQTVSQTIAIKGRGYGVPSYRVDGNDLLALVWVIGAAVDRARQGGGPTFIEAVTYRMGAHSTSDDPTRYRPDSEVEAWRKRDPVDGLRRHLAARDLVSEALDRRFDEEFAIEINEAIARAEASPPPARASLFDDVYAQMPWNLREQLAVLERTPPAPAHGDPELPRRG